MTDVALTGTPKATVVASELPHPKIDTTADTQRFWTELAAGRFTVPWCSLCDSWVWHPKPFCMHCLAPVDGERTLSGAGEVYSFSVVHRGMPGFDADSPYVLAYVALDGGPTVLSNIVGKTAADIRIGDRVRLTTPAPEVKVGACRFERIPE